MLFRFFAAANFAKADELRDGLRDELLRDELRDGLRDELLRDELVGDDLRDELRADFFLLLAADSFFLSSLALRRASVHSDL